MQAFFALRQRPQAASRPGFTKASRTLWSNKRATSVRDSSTEWRHTFFNSEREIGEGDAEPDREAERDTGRKTEREVEREGVLLLVLFLFFLGREFSVVVDAGERAGTAEEEMGGGPEGRGVKLTTASSELATGTFAGGGGGG